MIKILTDSTSDISKEYAKENGITVVPLKVHFGEEEYLDGIDLTPDEFFAKLKVCDKLPTTSQPSPEVFANHFEMAKNSGDTVVCIFISAELSGTYQSAQIAKSEVGYENIYIVDSKSVTIGETLLIKRAVDNVNAGMSAQEIVQDLEKAREHLHLLAIINDLTCLRKGGRLSGAAALAGGLLGIKPIVATNGKELEEPGHNGKLEVAGKARGLPGAYVATFKLIDKLGGIDESLHMSVGHTGDHDFAQPFIHYVQHNLKLGKPEIGIIGSVVGTHSGPGACAIAFFDKNLK